MSKLDEYMKMIEAVEGANRVFRASLNQANPGPLITDKGMVAWVDGHGAIYINACLWTPQDLRALGDWIRSLLATA